MESAKQRILAAHNEVVLLHAQATRESLEALAVAIDGLRQMDAWVKALVPFLVHKRGCGLEALGECDCGLDEALSGPPA
jgi:hypothetical protein